MGVNKFLKSAKEIQERAKKKPDEPHAPANHDESNWLVSYADMMTLLCGFFVMLFSFAKMDEPQYEKVKESMSKQFGGEYVNPSQNMADHMAQVIQEAGVDQQANVKVDGSGVVIAFESVLFFETLSAEVKQEGQDLLQKIILSIRERQEKEGKLYPIVVEGHTDSRPITAGTFPSNWELSGSRASRVVRYFLDRQFFPDQMTSIGYGDTRPLFPSRNSAGAYDETALAKNRRVVIRILSPQSDSIPLLPSRSIAQVAPPAAPAQKRTPTEPVDPTATPSPKPAESP